MSFWGSATPVVVVQEGENGKQRRRQLKYQQRGVAFERGELRSIDFPQHADSDLLDLPAVESFESFCNNVSDGSDFRKFVSEDDGITRFQKPHQSNESGDANPTRDSLPQYLNRLDDNSGDESTPLPPRVAPPQCDDDISMIPVKGRSPDRWKMQKLPQHVSRLDGDSGDESTPLPPRVAPPQCHDDISMIPVKGRSPDRWKMQKLPQHVNRLDGDSGDESIPLPPRVTQPQCDDDVSMIPVIGRSPDMCEMQKQRLSDIAVESSDIVVGKVETQAMARGSTHAEEGHNTSYRQGLLQRRCSDPPAPHDDNFWSDNDIDDSDSDFDDDYENDVGGGYGSGQDLDDEELGQQQRRSEEEDETGTVSTWQEIAGNFFSSWFGGTASSNEGGRNGAPPTEMSVRVPSSPTEGIQQRTVAGSRLTPRPPQHLDVHLDSENQSLSPNEANEPTTLVSPSAYQKRRDIPLQPETVSPARKIPRPSSCTLLSRLQCPSPLEAEEMGGSSIPRSVLSASSLPQKENENVDASGFKSEKEAELFKHLPVGLSTVTVNGDDDDPEGHDPLSLMCQDDPEFDSGENIDPLATETPSAKKASTNSVKPRREDFAYFPFGRISTVAPILCTVVALVLSIQTMRTPYFVTLQQPKYIGAAFRMVERVGLTKVKVCLADLSVTVDMQTKAKTAIVTHMGDGDMQNSRNSLFNGLIDQDDAVLAGPDFNAQTNVQDDANTICSTLLLTSEDIDDTMWNASRCFLTLSIWSGFFLSVMLFMSVTWKMINLKPIAVGLLVTYFFQSLAFFFFDSDLCREHECRLNVGSTFLIVSSILWFLSGLLVVRMDLKMRAKRRKQEKAERHRRKRMARRKTASKEERPARNKSAIDASTNTTTTMQESTPVNNGRWTFNRGSTVGTIVTMESSDGSTHTSFESLPTNSPPVSPERHGNLSSLESGLSCQSHDGTMYVGPPIGSFGSMSQC